MIELCNSINEPLTFSSRPDRMKSIMENAGFGKIKIVSMREANQLYCGSDHIEDSYFFATAETQRASAQDKLLLGRGENLNERN